MERWTEEKMKWKNAQLENRVYIFQDKLTLEWCKKMLLKCRTGLKLSSGNCPIGYFRIAMPLSQNESSSEITVLKMSFICTFIFKQIKLSFSKKIFVEGLVLKRRYILGYILGWGGAARPLIPWPCLRQISLIFLPCIRQNCDFWYPV